MKPQFVLTTALLVLWSSVGTAVVNVGRLPDIVDAGRVYTLNWTATLKYTYNLWLVIDDPSTNSYDWTKVQTLATGLHFDTLNVSLPFRVPTNLSATGDYGVWFGCFPIPSNGTNMYTNITNYFRVSNSSLASATASTSSASRTASATSTRSAAATTGASSSAPSSESGSSLSGGAIAGIVIGVLVLVALVIAAVLLRRMRRKKTDLQKREAAARANRLDHVMQVGDSAFEMHGRGPNKEMNVLMKL